MDLRTTQYYALDRGLDGMSLSDETMPASLPEQSTLVPPQLRYPAQLQQLLNKPDLGEFLASAFVLPTGNAVLSGPSQFAAALENAKAELRALLGDTAAPLAAPPAYAMGKAVPTSRGRSKASDRSGAELKSARRPDGASAFEPTSAWHSERKSGHTSGASSHATFDPTFDPTSGSVEASDEERDAAFDVKPHLRREFGSESDRSDAREPSAYGNTGSTSESGSAHSKQTLSHPIERLVQRAGRVLERESALRADLASYRAALLKG